LAVGAFALPSVAAFAAPAFDVCPGVFDAVFLATDGFAVRALAVAVREAEERLGAAPDEGRLTPAWARFGFGARAIRGPDSLIFGGR
jgi:hypothetical protein